MAARGFRKPLGPLPVAFGDVEIRRGAWAAFKGDKAPPLDSTSPPARVASVFAGANLVVPLLGAKTRPKDEERSFAPEGDTTAAGGPESGRSFLRQRRAPENAVAAGKADFVEPGATSAAVEVGGGGAGILPPLVRVFYPAEVAPENADSWRWRVGQWRRRRWLPGFAYAIGFSMMAVKPINAFYNVLLWLVAVVQWLAVYFSSVPAWAQQPLMLTSSAGGKSGAKTPRHPVVVFQHGAWAMRTTYTALACDLASYGYVVFCVEHRDGSACMSQFTEEVKEGGGGVRRLYLPHVHLVNHLDELEIRNKQLQQRVAEARAVIDLAHALNQGALTLSANLAPADVAADPRWFAGRLDLDRVAIAGHSFGAATAVAVAGVDPRPKVTLALDPWAEAWAEEEFKRRGGNAPMLVVDSVKFDWPRLNEYRNRLLGNRTSDPTLVTDKYTIKGSTHHNQSDFPLAATRLIKAMGMASDIDNELAQDCSSHLCLSFLERHMPAPKEGVGMPSLYRSEEVPERLREWVVFGKLGKTELDMAE